MDCDLTPLMQAVNTGQWEQALTRLDSLIDDAEVPGADRWNDEWTDGT